MAKKPAPKKPEPDPLDGYFLLRLPESYRSLLKAIKGKTHRAYTTDAQIALERFARHLGVEFTPNYPGDL